jgi:type III restriction enzyme
MIDLCDYQIKYIGELKDKINKLLTSSERDICVFQSPTGSGKTIMVAEALKRIVEERDDRRKFSFIWVSVRKLHDQSKDKLDRYYEKDRTLKCSYFWDLADKKIHENEILFINWESINKTDKNTIIKDNEQEFYLERVVENTKKEGRSLILIIDESHHTATSDKSRELIEKVILPDVTLEVSATPHLKEYSSEIVKVNITEVKDEEMIKSEVEVNPEFKNIKIGARDSDKVVIEQALKKRNELAGLYKKEKADINPLVLIQLPDSHRGIEEKKDRIIKILKDEFGITEQNGKLAIWLSEQKSETLTNIEKPNNEVEVLIFKQAIALGWDCPRASILAVFRESKSIVFKIQTIGRIMRMPELKYYENSELNKGFIFTNIAAEEAIIGEDYAKDYLTIYESKRDNKLYNKLKLMSIHLKRQREKTRLSGEFAKIFMKVTEESNLSKKLTAKVSKIVNPVIAEGKIINLDKTGEIAHGGTIKISLNERELQERFDNFIRGMCSPFAPYDSSDRMKTAIYNFLEKKLKIKRFDPMAQRIALSDKNIELFKQAIEDAKRAYNEKVIENLKEQKEVETENSWEVPEKTSYSSSYKEINYKKNVMNPFFCDQEWKTERKFMDALDKSKKVKWWYKNGKSESKYFAVIYTNDYELSHAFYVDFIVMFTDGKVGLFDTKLGTTALEAGPRANGLYKYIKEQNKKGRKLCGGIVVPDRETFRLNDQEDYDYDPPKFEGWKILEL